MASGSVDQAWPCDLDSSSGTQHSTQLHKTSVQASSSDSVHSSSSDLLHASSSERRQLFARHLPSLQVCNGRNRNFNGAEEPGDGTSRNVLSLESERMLASRIDELSQLKSPMLRELGRQLAIRYKIETPKVATSRNLVGGSPFANIHVGDRWQEIQGCNHWAGLLDPIDPVLRAEIVRYGEFAQACYDTFDGDPQSKYCGSSRYTKDVLLEKVGLNNRGYEITHFLYATARLILPNFFSRSENTDKWSKESNWMGFVAVCTSPQEIARLGRRDILVAWRGTKTTFESIKDLQDYSEPTSFDPRWPSVSVMGGFLNVYTSTNHKSRYNKLSVREQVLGAVKDLVEKYKHEGPLSITITGHSLGSSLAILCAYDMAESQMNLLSSTAPTVPKEWTIPSKDESTSDSDQTDGTRLRQDPKEKTQRDGGPTHESLHGDSGTNIFRSDRIPITVFSFAGPRVGNQAFRDRVEELGVAVLRVVNKGDLVTKVPGLLFYYVKGLLEAIVPRAPCFRHVGIKLKIDFLMSHYLEAAKLKVLGTIKDFRHPIRSHRLETYIHVVDGFHGIGLPFKPNLRDFALVNKGCDLLKPEYHIPSYWWQEKNKGLVKDENGHWVVPVRDSEIFPKTPIPVEELLHCVSIAEGRSNEKSGGQEDPVLIEQEKYLRSADVGHGAAGFFGSNELEANATQGSTDVLENKNHMNTTMSSAAGDQGLNGDRSSRRNSEQGLNEQGLNGDRSSRRNSEQGLNEQGLNGDRSSRINSAEPSRWAKKFGHFNLGDYFKL